MDTIHPYLPITVVVKTTLSRKARKGSKRGKINVFLKGTKTNVRIGSILQGECIGAI